MVWCLFSNQPPPFFLPFMICLATPPADDHHQLGQGGCEWISRPPSKPLHSAIRAFAQHKDVPHDVVNVGQCELHGHSAATAVPGSKVAQPPISVVTARATTDANGSTGTLTLTTTPAPRDSGPWGRPQDGRVGHTSRRLRPPLIRHPRLALPLPKLACDL